MLSVDVELLDVLVAEDRTVSPGELSSVPLGEGEDGGPIEGIPLAITMLVTSCVAVGLPITGGREVAIVPVLVVGSMVAVITLTVLGMAPGTLSQTLYTPIFVRSSPVQRETKHCMEASPIVRPDVVLDEQRYAMLEVKGQAFSW